MEERFETVEEFLTQYQNAKFVITPRLHVTLPCLALGTPVISTVDLNNFLHDSRWQPYGDWVYHVSEQDFVNGDFVYDYNNPPPNSDTYLAVRQSLAEQISAFVEETKDLDGAADEIRKTAYSDAQAHDWQYGLMQSTLEKWLLESRVMLKKLRNAQAEVKRLKQAPQAAAAQPRKRSKLKAFFRGMWKTGKKN
jgi:hypothetical protein